MAASEQAYYTAKLEMEWIGKNMSSECAFYCCRSLK